MMRLPFRRAVLDRLLLLLVVPTVGGTLVAQEWPQWRGPRRDGSVSGVTVPAWPTQLTRAWQAHVGIGHAAPVVSGNRVYVSTREGEEEVVRALDASSGRELWRVSHPVPYEMNPAARAHGKGPKSTPVVYQGRVFVLGIDGTLSSYETSTGKLAWRRASEGFPQPAPIYGTAMSPIVEGGLVIAHLGGEAGGAIVALDPATGRERWRWTGDGPGYASPIAVTLNGVRQIVTQTEKFIVGLAAADGRLLWREPFTTAFDQNVVTPVAWRDLLIFSGLDKGTFALRLATDGTRWTAERAWENPQVSMYMSSPVLVGDRLYGLTNRNKGQIVCLAAGTGRTLWTGPPRQGDNAAFVSTGDALLVLTTDAQLVVMRPSDRELDVVRAYDVADSATWAHPAIVPGGVLVKDVETLALWRW